MNITQTGISTATLIPVGATITAATWNVPTSYTEGFAFDTRELALIFAINQMVSAVEVHNTFYAQRSGVTIPLPERITIDLRWTLSYPGGSENLVAQRTEYATIADAREALALFRKFADA